MLIRCISGSLLPSYGNSLDGISKTVGIGSLYCWRVERINSATVCEIKMRETSPRVVRPLKNSIIFGTGVSVVGGDSGGGDGVWERGEWAGVGK